MKMNKFLWRRFSSRPLSRSCNPNPSMHNHLIAVCLLTSLTSLAQETERVMTTTGDPAVQEEYYIIKGHRETKQGPYTKTTFYGTAKGQYESNVRVGVWEYYDSRGDLEQKIDFTKHEVVFTKPFKPLTKSWLLENGEIKEYTSGTPPVVIGGMSAVGRSITSTIHYPSKARRGGHMGDVTISATITKEGKMIDEKIETGPGYGLDEEALRVVQLIDEEWFPLTIDGVARDARIFMVITFRLSINTY
jgi:TonB family protein